MRIKSKVFAINSYTIYYFKKKLNLIEKWKKEHQGNKPILINV
jgi:hypothetical protein